MSKLRKKTVLFFLFIVGVSILFIFSSHFGVSPDPVSDENQEMVKNEKPVEEETVPLLELVVTPLETPPSSEAESTIKTESAILVERSAHSYPESYVFKNKKTETDDISSQNMWAESEEDFGDDPMLPSRPITHARHISEKKIVTDSSQSTVMSGKHLMNGRHLTRKFTHVIEDGDSLELIAQRYMWDPSRAKDIYEENKDILPSMTELPIGVKITLPERK
ncbi:MAG: LysM domain-containing protein [Planctomycetia bacterium]|nr:LysM domain-containing protein [Planctomycetia bacterium]